jgi:hypothetical protein
MEHKMRTKRTDFLREEPAAHFLGVPVGRMEKLRQNEKLPFLVVRKSVRLYYLPDLYEWLFKRKRVLGLETKNKESVNDLEQLAK